jgi:LemA protein
LDESDFPGHASSARPAVLSHRPFSERTISAIEQWPCAGICEILCVSGGVMGVVGWLVLGAVVVVLYFWYATIVKRRNRVAEALGGIDVQLQQRHDLIPNVLVIARRFMEHERTLLTEITDLRAKAHQQIGERDFGKIGEKFETEARLGQQMGRLLGLAENYPQLRSDGPMIEAQRTYSEVEANIAAARRFYNTAVADLGNAVQIFPGPLLMGFAGVKSVPPTFQAVDAARTAVDASKHL